MGKLKLLLIILGLFSVNLNAKPFGGVRDDANKINNTLQEIIPIADKLADGIFCLSHPGNNECRRNGGILSSSPSSFPSL